MLVAASGVNYWEPESSLPAYPEGCFSATPVAMVYDTTRGFIPGLSWTEALAGNPNDTLVQIGSWPTVVPANPLYNNRPTITGTGVANNALKSAVPAAATLVTQPLTIVWVGTHSLLNGTYHQDGAILAARCLHSRVVGNCSINAGVSLTAIPAPITPAVVWGAYNLATSQIRVLVGGVPFVSGIGNVGGNSLRGVTLCAQYNGASAATGTFTLLLVLAGVPTAGEIAMFETWCQRRCGIP